MAYEQIMDALRHSDSSLQLEGLQSLHLRLAQGEHSQEYREPLIQALRSLVMSPDVEISDEAARALRMVAGTQPETAELLLLRAESAAVPSDGEHYVYLLYGMDLGPVEDKLVALATGPTDEISVAATVLLLRLSEPPDELLPHVVRHAQHPLFYGDMSLVGHLKKYGAKAVPYLPDLVQMRDRLASEETLPIGQRTINVTRDGDTTTVNRQSHAIPTLDDTISYLTNLSEADR